MRRAIFLSLALLVCACSRSAPIDQASLHKQCAHLATLCKKDCTGGEFKACYVDTEIFGDREQYDVRQECHGVHVGSTCAPCKHIFSLNFGGAMREVDCETFLLSIARKNQECSNCMKKVGWSPLVE